MDNELSIIENLEEGELIDLLITIFKKTGYYDIEYKSDKKIIEASIKAGVNRVKTTFLIFQEHLTADSFNSLKFAELVNQYVKSGSIVILSNKKITNGFKSNFQNKDNSEISFIDRDDLVKFIEEYEIDFWRHKDTRLLEYEKYLSEEIKKDTHLKKISAAETQIERLKSIFIDPIVYEYHSDKESSNPSRSKISLAAAGKKEGVTIISGEAGIGKSTILKKLIQEVIANNDEGEMKVLPIYILANNLIDSQYSIINAINNEIENHFEISLFKLSEHYKISVFIDSIDEFSVDVQDKLLSEIKDISSTNKFDIFCATRSYDQLITNLKEGGVNALRVQKFGTEQIKRFVTSFFIKDNKKSQYLLDALKDKMIIERLPMTPLTISLISILYEEREFEIPATITDIYDSFNSLILGKTTITTSYDFIDINFKQRILTYYAYTLLNSKDHEPFTKDDFFDLIENFYLEKTLSIDEHNLREVLVSLIKNSGVLIERKGRVIFKHDSFMEYYASIEYFNFRREEENKLVENFHDVHWQNVAIFYAGRTKDMEKFLTKINEEISTYTNINQLFSSISGTGFLLQTLYETDSKIRKGSIEITLENLIKIHSLLSKIAADKPKLFKNHNYPTLYAILSMLYHDHFNSITLKTPLALSYKYYLNKYRDSGDEAIGYKLLLVGTILSSDRINEEEYIQEIIYDTDLLNKPILTILAQFSLDTILNKTSYKEIQKEVAKRFDYLKDPIKAYLKMPIKKLRHTNLDLIAPDLNVQLFFEGETDGLIVEHAFFVLTNGRMPYWNYKKPKNGGAEKLAKRIYELDEMIADDDKIYIGVFDNDSKGIQEFKGVLKSDKFLYDPSKDKRLKKHKTKDIYAIKLPIPASMENYVQKKQQDNYFAIEHYLPIEFLIDNKIIEETAIPNIYSVRKKANKKKLVKKIKEIRDKDFFQKFICLFDEIDRISDIEVEYENI